MQLGIRQCRKDEDSGWTELPKQVGQKVESLLDAQVQVEENDVGPRQIRVRQRCGSRLCFPKHRHPWGTFEQHAESGPDDRMILDNADLDGRRHICLSDISLWFHRHYALQKLGLGES